MFEARTVPRFFLLPALVLGAIGVVAWSHGPWGADKKLDVERRKYVAMRDLQRQAAGETVRWRAVFIARGVLLDQARKDGARAVAAASRRQTQSNQTSFRAGVIAGRALERKAHALRNPDASAAGPAVGDGGVYVDFRDLWCGGRTDCDDAEGLPAGSDGAGP